jgi:RHS repeat-associated protein
MQYAGEMLDAASGLYDLRARQYDSNSGRFLSQDPAAATSQTARTYVYANDDPTAYVDPSGTTPRKGGFVATACPGLPPPPHDIYPQSTYFWPVCIPHYNKPIGHWFMLTTPKPGKALVWAFTFELPWLGYSNLQFQRVTLNGLTYVNGHGVQFPDNTPANEYSNYGFWYFMNQGTWQNSVQRAGNGPNGWYEDGCANFWNGLYSNAVADEQTIHFKARAAYTRSYVDEAEAFLGGSGLADLSEGLYKLAKEYSKLTIVDLGFRVRWHDGGGATGGSRPAGASG